MIYTPIEKAAFESFRQVIKPLQPLLDSHDISEIMVNWHDSIWIERRGRMEKTDIAMPPQMIGAAIKLLATGTGIKEVIPGTESGIVNAAFENTRLAGVLSPTAIDGDAMCIRKHSRSVYTPDDYVRNGSFDLSRVEAERQRTEIFEARPGMQNNELVSFIEQEVVNKKNFLIGGGTNAGKTSLINALLSFIPKHERVITIEDTQELKVNAPNRIRLLSNASKGVTATRLLELCLRFKPDRIIVGELRDGVALDFLQALNTGHDGGFASLHANDESMTLARIETLALRGLPPGQQSSVSLIRKDVSDCIDYVLHFKKSASSDFRFLSGMVAIQGFENGNYKLQKLF